ncbi:hypothetical protein J1614_000036 [Plenodomus biglobosus]|nr:hypothetical protein J1614_000036 [Plenodomus biglobosus]
MLEQAWSGLVGSHEGTWDQSASPDAATCTVEASRDRVRRCGCCGVEAWDGHAGLGALPIGLGWVPKPSIGAGRSMAPMTYMRVGP